MSITQVRSSGTDRGRRLVFLISQPRSGSTLLQRLLSQHPEIASAAEPWIMLPLLYARRSEGLKAEYNAWYARRGLEEYLQSLPSGDQIFAEAVRAAALTLYDGAMAASAKSLFLDKTPRYYLILPELMALFPEAAFVFLVRNPLDVMASILETHAQGDWTDLGRRDRIHDLVTAPTAIVEATSSPSRRQIVVRYEDLVGDPQRTLSDICGLLRIGFDARVLHYEGADDPGRLMGDSRSIHRHNRPVTEYLESWRQRLDTDDKRGLALAYLHHLGRGTVEHFGFNFVGLVRTLSAAGAAVRQGEHRWRLITMPRSQRTWRQRLELQTAHSLLRRGWGRTFGLAAYITAFGRPPSPGPLSGADSGVD